MWNILVLCLLSLIDTGYCGMTLLRKNCRFGGASIEMYTVHRPIFYFLVILNQLGNPMCN